MGLGKQEWENELFNEPLSGTSRTKLSVGTEEFDGLCEPPSPIAPCLGSTKNETSFFLPFFCPISAQGTFSDQLTISPPPFISYNRLLQHYYRFRSKRGGGD